MLHSGGLCLRYRATTKNPKRDRLPGTTQSLVDGLADALNTAAASAVIQDGSLTIAKTAGLQTALDSKQTVVTDGSLTISKTNGLQSALDSKQAVVTDGSLSI